MRTRPSMVGKLKGLYFRPFRGLTWVAILGWPPAAGHPTCKPRPQSVKVSSRSPAHVRYTAPRQHRRHPRPAGQGRLYRRPLAGDGALSCPAHGPAAVPGGRGRHRQDRDRQGAGQEPRPQSDPAAMLRGARRFGRGLRVELRRADDRHPAGRSGRQRGRATASASSTTCSPRNSSSSGRCCRRSSPIRPGPRCC